MKAVWFALGVATALLLAAVAVIWFFLTFQLPIG